MSSDLRTRKFQAETRKLLDLMIHSVYAQREVFLRELISNASDAIDKARYLALTDTTVDQTEPFAIRLLPDAAAGTLSVADNGIGMTYDEVVANIGTIAASGTEAFARAVAADGGAADGDGTTDAEAGAVDFGDGEGVVGDADGVNPDTPARDNAGQPDLIGRFGVGFYSAFMVADKVELVTCKHGADHAVRWESSGGDAYRIAKLPPGERGTRITLHLKGIARGQGADAADGGDPPKDFTDAAVLRGIVKRHSDFVAFPIRLEAAGDDGLSSEPLNSMQPLWSRPKSEIDAAAYDDFYRHLTRDWEPPLAHVHVRAEGQYEYAALLYLPSHAPFDLYQREGRRGLQLYAKRVFIMDECRDLMPEHLRWVRGVVDSPDLPLNISREMVQEDRLISAIRRHLTRRVYDELGTLLADDRARYETFWADFGAAVKEGLHHEPGDTERLRGLLLFRSTAVEGFTTLDEYTGRLLAGQSAIYYLAGDDAKLMRGAPQLEGFRARGIEVLLLTDAVDELVVSQLRMHADVPFRSAGETGVDLSAITPRAQTASTGGATDTASDAAGADAAGGASDVGTDGDADVAGDAGAKGGGRKRASKRKAANVDGADGASDGARSAAALPTPEAAAAERAALAPLCDRLAALLGETVTAVRPSDRLTTSAACLVVPEGSPSDHLLRLMKALGQDVETTKRVLELNPSHPVVRALVARHTSAPDDDGLLAYADLLYDSALVAEGQPPRDPVRYAQAVAEVMAAAVAAG
jgi:molecular chaperone HtpG